jgi:hypothetical protein
MRRLISWRGAGVLALALLSACDAPTTISETQFEGSARRLAVPVVTVSSYGSYLMISWGALSGATSYTVSAITHVTQRYYGYETDHSEYLEELGTTPETFVITSARSYTGLTSCTSLTRDRNGYDYVYQYEYEVIAHFPDGTSRGSVFPAPVADRYCSTWWY